MTPLLVAVVLAIVGNAGLAHSAPVVPAEGAVRLAVAAVRQEPERCGPAALRMVLAYYGARDTALAEADRAYDPVLRGSLITDLAAAARRAGYSARVEAASDAALDSLLTAGVPPILLGSSGFGPITRGHYVVLVGSGPGRDAWFINDGGSTTRRVGRRALLRRWRSAGGQALVVSPRGAEP